MAVGTASVDIVTANYVLVGVAPMILQLSVGSAAVIAVATSLPGPTAVGLRIEPGDPLLPITGVGNVYARAIRNPGKIVAAILA